MVDARGTGVRAKPFVVAHAFEYGPNRKLACAGTTAVALAQGLKAGRKVPRLRRLKVDHPAARS